MKVAGKNDVIKIEFSKNEDLHDAWPFKRQL